MAADYYISGVWFANAHVIYVLLHNFSVNGGRGVKVSERDVIALLDAKKDIATMIWSYTDKKWYIGEFLTTIDHPSRGRILRTHKDKQQPG